MRVLFPNDPLPKDKDNEITQGPSTTVGDEQKVSSRMLKKELNRTGNEKKRTEVVAQFFFPRDKFFKMPAHTYSESDQVNTFKFSRTLCNS